MNSQLFAARPGRDYSLLIQRTGTTFLTDGRLRGLETRLDREEDEDFGFVHYRGAENWDEWESHAKYPHKYFQLNIDVNHIEFDHHWLFSSEDSLAREMKNLFDGHVVIGESVLKLVQNLMTAQHDEQMRRRSEDEHDDDANEGLTEMGRELADAQKNYQHVGQLLENAWLKLQEVRRASGIRSTGVVLEKVESLANMEVPDELREFFSTASYTLREEPVEASSITNKTENERIAAISKCRIQVQVYFNDLFVCKTEDVPMSRNFVAKFAHVYCLRIYEKPEEITLVVRERFGRTAWKELARIFVPLPVGDEESEAGNQATLKYPGLDVIEFASDIVQNRYKGSMGCGQVDVSQNLHGKLYCKAKWVDNGTHFRSDEEKRLIRDTDKFALIPQETRLVSDEEFASDVRLEALHNRYHGRHFGASLNGLGTRERARQRWIGLTAAEVDNTWLTDEFKAVDIAGAGFARASVAGFDSSLDTYRHIGQRYAAMIRKHMLESLARDHRLKNYNDIVREEPIPSGGTFGFLLPAPDVSRKLKPMRSKVTRPQAPSRGRYKVVINIQSATNVPERISGEPTNVFVEVGFQKQYVTTAAVQGSQANWQETLTMELAVQGDDHQVELKSIMDHFEFNLYDVEVLELEHDDREPNTVHEQYERRWLGSVEIPFSTIYSLGKIDGSLPVTPPYFCTGYKFSERFTFLKLLITTNPPLASPGFPSYDNFPANESSEILNACQQWEKRCKSRFSDRRYLALANDANGKRVLACRFLRGIQPPPHVSRLSADPFKAVELAAHVASCIPFVADPVMFPGVCDLWTTTDQMITIGCGDGEEHAILLVCWLLSIGVTAALLLGTALPEGPKAAYALVQFDENVSWLVNPSDGKHYATNDPTCPLVSVGTVITSGNIYGNVQPAAHPSLLHFDLRKKAHWDPLFPEPRTDLISVQIENIGYTDVSEDILLELRSSLEREIRLRFDEVRPYAVPQWNLLASRALREILNEAEDSGAEHVDVESRLERLRLAYKIRAVAFRKPYVSKAKLVEDVLRTTVHVNSDQNAQFALAVHIQPFVNNIVSCSVALASLTPNA
ncbi:hypothetical protein AAVH_04878 [Aphelenchoides avenae]|nr:hypothetical protein AAVH_04878 [Aphelenchus avenae]